MIGPAAVSGLGFTHADTCAVPASGIVLARGDDHHDRRPDRGRERDQISEGSAWDGSRTNNGDSHDLDGRVISRTDTSMVLRTKEKDNDGLTLEWTFDVKDTSLKLVKVVTTSKGDGQREDVWGSGEVRNNTISLDYGWTYREGKGNGKGKKVEGSLKLKRT